MFLQQQIRVPASHSKIAISADNVHPNFYSYEPYEHYGLIHNTIKTCCKMSLTSACKRIAHNIQQCCVAKNTMYMTCCNSLLLLYTDGCLNLKLCSAFSFCSLLPRTCCHYEHHSRCNHIKAAIAVKSLSKSLCMNQLLEQNRELHVSPRPPSF